MLAACLCESIKASERQAARASSIWKEASSKSKRVQQVPTWPQDGPTWPQLGPRQPQHGPSRPPCLDISHLSTEVEKNVFGPHPGLKLAHPTELPHGCHPPTSSNIQRHLHIAQHALHMAQNGPTWPTMAQHDPNIPPTCPQDGPTWPQDSRR